jgi:hypothetical protein
MYVLLHCLWQSRVWVRVFGSHTLVFHTLHPTRNQLYSIHIFSVWAWDHVILILILNPAHPQCPTSSNQPSCSDLSTHRTTSTRLNPPLKISYWVPGVAIPVPGALREISAILWKYSRARRCGRWGKFLQELQELSLMLIEKAPFLPPLFTSASAFDAAVLELEASYRAAYRLGLLWCGLCILPKSEY